MAAPKEVNPVRMLFAAHFVPCEIIFKHCMQTKPMFFNPSTQAEVGQAFIAYTHLWMALLYVVAEAFKELKLNDPTITPLIDAHLHDLRVFRNSVFHFQKDDRKRTQFHDVDKFNWAQQLHVAFQRYFTAWENT
jgi:hypothetical protein